MAIHIVLVEPEIPPNTGNICAELCRYRGTSASCKTPGVLH